MEPDFIKPKIDDKPKEKKSDPVVKITRKGISVFRLESELQKYLADGWVRG